jgi:hypothetical protein
MTGSPARQLRDVSARLYPTQEAALRLVQRLGVDPSYVTPGASSVETWSELLYLLAVQGKLRQAVQRMLAEFPNEQSLRDLLADPIPMETTLSELSEAIASDVSREGLQRVALRLGMNVNRITSSLISYRDQIAQLLQFAAAQGQLAQLVPLLMDANPSSQRLAAAGARVLGRPLPSQVGQTDGDVKDPSFELRLAELRRQLCTIELPGNLSYGPMTAFLAGRSDVITHIAAFPDWAKDDLPKVLTYAKLLFEEGHGKLSSYQTRTEHVLTDSGVLVLRCAEPIGQISDGLSGRTRGWIFPTTIPPISWIFPTAAFDPVDAVLIGRGSDALIWKRSTIERLGGRLRADSVLDVSAGAPWFDLNWRLIGVQSTNHSLPVEGVSVAQVLEELDQAGFAWNPNLGIVPNQSPAPPAKTGGELDNVVKAFSPDVGFGETEDDVWEDDDDPSDPDSWAWAEAAAVNTYYDPERLRFPGATPSEAAKTRVLLASQRIARDGQARWMLSDQIRRRALSRLTARGQLKIMMDLNAPVFGDPADVALRDLVTGRQLESWQLQDPEQLRAYLKASRWLQGSRVGAPASLDLQTALDRAELLAPFRHLTKGFFAGRIDELREVSDYIEYGGPCLMIHGPGGTGKSSLLARAILSHSDRDTTNKDAWRPFAYLDFDRPDLDARDHAVVVAAMLRQLQSQLPELLRPIGDILASSIRTDQKNRTAHLIDAIKRSLPDLLTKVDSAPVLLDSLEEVQYATPDAVGPLVAMLTDLSIKVPRLRPIFAGRIPVDEKLPLIQIELGPLSDDEAKILLGNLLPPTIAADSNLINEMVKRVGGNPLSLKLAAELLKKEPVLPPLGSEDEEFWRRVGDRVVQGYLYERIVGHLHDEEVEKLAVPGLVLRYLTADLIIDVLAGPCALRVATIAEAEALLRKLATETALVRTETDESRLALRPELRRTVLESFRRDKSTLEQRATIHALAIRYFEQRKDVGSRAEEIYHRLMLHQDPSLIDRRWLPGVEQSLRSVVDELDGPDRSFLAVRVGRLEEADTEAHANTEDWELYAERRASDLLAMGMASAALDVIDRRNDRSSRSPLYILESRAARSISTPDLARAENAATAAVAAAEISHDPRRMAEAYEELAQLKKASGDQQGLFDTLLRLAGLADRLGEDRLALEANVSGLESAKSAPPIEFGLNTLRIFARLPDRVIASAPELARRVAAQAGGEYPEILKRVAHIAGFGSITPDQGASLREILTNWSKRDPSVGAFVPPPSSDGEAISNAARYLLEQRRLDRSTADELSDWLRKITLPTSWSNPKLD